jgi:hypothetical protein
MNTNFRKIGVLLFLSMFFAGCGGSDPVPSATCITVGTPFQQLETNLLTSTMPIYGTNVNMDLDTHEYTFKLLTNKTVCSIGYQNQGGYTGQYLMKIMQGPTVLYSGNHSFVSSSTVFIPITPVALTAGVSYTISRTLLTGTITNHQLGKVIVNATGANIPYPVTDGNMTILSSTFYGSGGPVNNNAIPYIDFGTN